jgi:hypothetical protein
MAGLALTCAGLYDHMPSTRFRKYVSDPMPTSVGNIRIAMADSLGDGRAWIFVFNIDPAEFEKLRQAMTLRELPLDRAARDIDVAKQLADLPSNAIQTPEWIKDKAWPEDKLLRRDSRGLYMRPTDARFFTGPDRTVVVTGGKNSVVYVYRNFWADHGER